MGFRRHDINEFLARGSTLGADGTRPANTQGTSVTPGASNTYGSYASLGVPDSTNDSYEIELFVTTVAASTSNRMVMVTLGIDPAGGTSFTDVWSDVLVGAPDGNFSTGLHFTLKLPFFIKAGTSIGIKAASLDATTTAIKAWAYTDGKPTRPDLLRHGKFVQTFGVSSPTVGGVAVTPGAGSDGTYVEIGTLDKPLWFFDFGYSINDTTMSVGIIFVDIALGDATNKRVIIRDAPVITTATEGLVKRSRGVYADGKVGDKIYARAQHSGTADSSNSVAVYGVGG